MSEYIGIRAISVNCFCVTRKPRSLALVDTLMGLSFITLSIDIANHVSLYKCSQSKSCRNSPFGTC